MRQCEHCGAFLDPEEHCDCQKQAAAATCRARAGRGTAQKETAASCGNRKAAAAKRLAQNTTQI